MPTPTPLPTMFLDGSITYGDYGLDIVLLCIIGLLIIGGIAFLILRLLDQKGK